MATPGTNTNYNIYIINGVLIVIFLSLAGIGVRLMLQSEDLYADSVTLTKAVLKANKGLTAGTTAPNYGTIKDGYTQALSFFILAIGCILLIFLLPRIQTLSIGPSGVNLSLQALQQNVNSLMQQNNTIQAVSTGTGGIATPVAAAEAHGLDAGPITPAHDSQKGKWGGKADNNFRNISAVVSKSDLDDFFVVCVTVQSTNKSFPLTGIVTFHLDYSFSNHKPVIAVQNDVATLELKKVKGPFTIGAETDNGKTTLELDLNTIDKTPPGFAKKTV